MVARAPVGAVAAQHAHHPGQPGTQLLLAVGVWVCVCALTRSGGIRLDFTVPVSQEE